MNEEMDKQFSRNYWGKNPDTPCTCVFVEQYKTLKNALVYVRKVQL